MHQEEKHKEKSRLLGGAALVIPCISFAHYRYYRHLYQVQYADDDRLKAIDKKNFLWIPVKENSAEYGYQVCCNQKIVTSGKSTFKHFDKD